jgi:hypothetical protein
VPKIANFCIDEICNTRVLDENFSQQNHALDVHLAKIYKIFWQRKRFLNANSKIIGWTKTRKRIQSEARL